jgi:hypothetical protein
MKDKKRKFSIKISIFLVLAFIIFFLFTTSVMAAIVVNESNQPVRRECQISYRDLFSGPVIELVDLPTRIYWSVGQVFSLDHTFFYRCSDTEQFNEALQIFASIAAPKLELVIHHGPRYDFAPNKTRVDWTFTIWNQKGLDDLFKKNEEITKIFEPHYGSILPAPRIDLYIGDGAIVWEEVKVPENISVMDKRGKLVAPEMPPVSNEPQAEISLPEEISEFYKKWNFVSALSIPEERTVLLSYIEKQENLPEQMMENERLKKVYESIMELGKCELPGIDPEFTYPKITQMTYDRIFSIYKAKRNNGEISIEAVFTTLTPEDMKGRIARYEKKDDLPEGIEGPRFKKNTEPFKGIISPRFTSKEIHIWKLIDGKWMKAEISYELLNLSK